MAESEEVLKSISEGSLCFQEISRQKGSERFCDFMRGILSNEDLANLRDKDGTTALMWSCFYGNEELTTHLLSLGAQIKTCNHTGHSAVEYALKGSSIRCLSLICEKLLQNEQSLKDIIQRQEYQIKQCLHQIMEIQQAPEVDLVTSTWPYLMPELNQNLLKTFDHTPPSRPDNRDDEITRLTAEASGLMSQIQQLEVNFGQFKFLRGIEQGRVAVLKIDSEDDCSKRILTGVFDDRCCVVKLAHTEKEWKKLEAEKNILHELRSQFDDGSGQYIVIENGMVSTCDSTLWFHNGCEQLLTSPLNGMVLEAGGPNLFQFYHFWKNKNKFPDILTRINILRDVREAVEFIHGSDIIHGDLKPENIVCFSYLSKGLLRWKLIDFDNSCKENKNECFAKEDFSFTPLYSAPEIRLFLQDPERFPLRKVKSLDIWSLGIVAFFIFADHQDWNSVCRRLHLFSISQKEIESILMSFSEFQDKEKSFVESCIQINPTDRWSVSDLSNKKLFTTQPSTIQANSLRYSNEEIQKLLRELYLLQKELPTQRDLSMQLNEFYDELILKLAHLLSMSREDIVNLLRRSFSQDEVNRTTGRNGDRLGSLP